MQEAGTSLISISQLGAKRATWPNWYLLLPFPGSFVHLGNSINFLARFWGAQAREADRVGGDDTAVLMMRCHSVWSL